MMKICTIAFVKFNELYAELGVCELRESTSLYLAKMSYVEETEIPRMRDTKVSGLVNKILIGKSQVLFRFVLVFSILWHLM